jgi:hypothetical protein
MLELVGFRRHSGYRVAFNFHIRAKTAVNWCEIGRNAVEMALEFHIEKIDLDGGNRCLR